MAVVFVPPVFEIDRCRPRIRGAGFFVILADVVAARAHQTHHGVRVVGKLIFRAQSTRRPFSST